ncbi:putative MarR family transcriptional regulator [Gordonia effusa NBRC 100432]|uniref:Putative MarR family transcriptional regulator n=1 Tax=Gordonia effusa NBRC 100432 TaxID=1077974 RepID=H0R154_9ACTN|nr:MarR family transcriptional regulator [Gordonia effusa]GAB18805.1 putative MarR family transcriptional regulator [Gordonia effusa NBRC 100432]
MTDDNSEKIVHALRAVVVRLHLAASEFGQTTGLHPTDIRALILLLDDERGGRVSTPSDLAGRLGLNSASTTALLDRLEGSDFIRRNPHATDRRKVVVSITPHAVNVGQEFFGPTITRLTAALGDYSADETAAVARFLGDVDSIIG